MVRLEEAVVAHLAIGVEMDAESTAALLHYLDLCREHSYFDHAREDSQPPWFEDAVWPSFVNACCDANYYLSADELLLCCELQQQNIAVFGRRQGEAQYLGAITGHGSTQRLVTLHLDDAAGRVRSHFQRLVPAVQASRSAHESSPARPPQLELLAMAAADRESQSAADMAAAADEEKQKAQQEKERDPADEFHE